MATGRTGHRLRRHQRLIRLTSREREVAVRFGGRSRNVALTPGGLDTRPVPHRTPRGQAPRSGGKEVRDVNSPAVDQVDVVVLDMGWAGRAWPANSPRPGSASSESTRSSLPESAPTGLRAEQDDDPSGEPARRDRAGDRHGGHGLPGHRGVATGTAPAAPPSPGLVETPCPGGIKRQRLPQRLRKLRRATGRAAHDTPLCHAESHREEPVPDWKAILETSA